MALALVLMLVASALTLLTPYLIKVAIDQHIAGGDTAGPDSTIALLTAAAFVGIYADLGHPALSAGLGGPASAGRRARAAVPPSAGAARWATTTRHIVGVTVSRVINDVAMINDLLSQGLITLIGDTLMLVGIVVVMLSMSPRLALLTFIVLPLMLLVTWLFARRAGVAFRQTRSRWPRWWATWPKNICRHARDPGLRAGGRLAASASTRSTAPTATRNIAAMSLSFIFLPTVEFLGMLATAIVLWFGGRRWRAAR